MATVMYLCLCFVSTFITPMAIASAKLLSRDAKLIVNNVELADTHAGYKAIRTEVIVCNGAMRAREAFALEVKTCMR